MICEYCTKWADMGLWCLMGTHGECDCPKCQSLCECHLEEPEYNGPSAMLPMDDPDAAQILIESLYQQIDELKRRHIDDFMDGLKFGVEYMRDGTKD